jgi:hypothetical protein
MPDMNSIKSVPWWVWLIPTTLLLVATARLPYGYYTFTRFVVCGVAGLIAVIGWNEGPTSRKWSVFFAGIAVLFNPIIPIYLKRGTWFYWDIGVAAAFIVHLILYRIRPMGAEN